MCGFKFCTCSTHFSKFTKINKIKYKITKVDNNFTLMPTLLEFILSRDPMIVRSVPLSLKYVVPNSLNISGMYSEISHSGVKYFGNKIDNQ